MFNESEAYERFMGRWSRLLAPGFVTFSEVGEGHRVLDVGSGTGALAEAVEMATERVEIVGIDPSETYVAEADRRSRSSRVRFEVGDAQQLRFEDQSFDRILSLLVVNFIPDPRKALREMIRVTRPGGIVSACVWDYAEGMEMLRVFWDEVVALDPAAAQRDERHMPYCGEGQLSALWTEEGLGSVEQQALRIQLDFGSFADYWSPFLEGQGPAGAYVLTLTPDQRQALEQRLRERLLPGRPDGAIRLEARAWAVKGTVRRQ